MTQHEQPSDPNRSDIVDEAAQLSLAVIGEATALHTADEDSMIAAEDNVRETIDDLVDEPFTERQEQVVAALAASSAALTAGLAGAAAADEDRPVGEVLHGAARSVVMQQWVAGRADDEGPARG